MLSPKGLSKLVALVLGPAVMAVGLVATTGCNGGGTACPMGIILDDPLVHIRDAKSSASGAGIPLLILSDIKIRGRLQQTADMSFLLPRRARNVAIDGVTLRCTVPCDFAVESGSYEFTVSASGYRDRVVFLPDVRATQSEKVDECRFREFGGVDVSVTLDPN